MTSALTMLEAGPGGLQVQVTKLARGFAPFGLLYYHPRQSDRDEPGFLDCTFLAHGRIMVRELKSEKGRMTKEQEAWHEAWQIAGVDVDVWRPSDLLSGRISRELRRLALGH